jgi:hypothetical protein
MVAKTAKSLGQKSSKKKPEPLEVRLTLSYKFGDESDDSVTIMNNRSVPMVNSVFDNRDRILRGLVVTLLKAGASQPKVMRELFPAAKVLKKLRGR